MFCPNCGTNLPDESEFCVQCGKQLGAAPKTKAKKKKSPWPGIIISLVLVAAIAAGLWFFVFSAKETVYLLSREVQVYDNNGQTETVREYEYDGNGRLLSYEESSGHPGNPYQRSGYRLSYTYDKTGKIIAAELERDEETIELEYIYEKGVLVEVTGEGENCEVEASADRNGLIQSLEIMYENGSVCEYSYEYDSEGNLEAKSYEITSDYVNAIAEYEYDSHGNQISCTYIIDGSEADSWKAEFDKNGNQTSQSYALGGYVYTKWEAEYDEDGFLCAVEYDCTNDSGEKMEYHCEVERDGLEIILTLTCDEQDGEWVVELVYDKNGNLLERREEQEDSSVTYTWEYDENGNVIEYSMEGDGYSSSHTYEYIKVRVSEDTVLFDALNPIWFVDLLG